MFPKFQSYQNDINLFRNKLFGKVENRIFREKLYREFYIRFQKCILNWSNCSFQSDNLIQVFSNSIDKNRIFFNNNNGNKHHQHSSSSCYNDSDCPGCQKCCYSSGYRKCFYPYYHGGILTC